MKPTRRMLISTGVVGVVLVGGVSVAATASAGRLQQASKVSKQDSRPGSGQVTPAAPGPVEITDSPTTPPSYDPDVVSTEMTDDPGQVSDYWTKERMEGADPMPMPQVSISIITPTD